MTAPAITIQELHKTFGKHTALDHINLEIEPGEFVALIGPSGSGKSTLLRHISGLVPADKNGGAIHVFGKPVQKNGRINRRIREVRADIGFIFQQFNLVGRLTLLQNVLTGMLNRVPAWRSLPRLFTRSEKISAMQSLYRVGLHDHCSQRASTLSGGQQQRAAIARTMEQRAKLILADEPIASLDPESARMVMDCLAQLNKSDKVTVVISLHQVQFALQYCSRSIALKNGKVIFDGPSEQLTTSLLKEIYGTREGLNLDGTTPINQEKKVRPQIPKAIKPGLAQAGV